MLKDRLPGRLAMMFTEAGGRVGVGDSPLILTQQNFKKSLLDPYIYGKCALILCNHKIYKLQSADFFFQVTLLPIALTHWTRISFQIRSSGYSLNFHILHLSPLIKVHCIQETIKRNR